MKKIPDKLFFCTTDFNIKLYSRNKEHDWQIAEHKNKIKSLDKNVTNKLKFSFTEQIISMPSISLKEFFLLFLTYFQITGLLNFLTQCRISDFFCNKMVKY